MTPRVEGPLFSVGAHGTLDNALTYQTRGGRARAYKYTVPPDARSAAQLLTRATFLKAARLWSIMTDADRLAWCQDYQTQNQTGYNLWQQLLYNRMTRSHEWTNPDHHASGMPLPNFPIVIPMQLYSGTTVYDISGNHRHWTPDAVSQGTGTRGQYIEAPSSNAAQTVANSTHLGDLPQLTLGALFYSSIPSGSQTQYAWSIGYQDFAGEKIALLYQRVPGFMLRIGDGASHTDLQTTTPYLVNRWNQLLATFDGTDSGRMTIILNGDIIAETTTAHTIAKDSSQPVSVARNAVVDGWQGNYALAFMYKGITNALRL